jgi:hypothetical protein
MSELGFQADHEDGEQSFDPIPAGEYIVAIVDSDYIDNKKGTGKMLKIVYQVIDGNFKDHKIFENLNLEHQNQQAATIARKSLNSICKALDIIELKDSEQLHNIPLRLDVGIKDNDEYGPQNKIKKHLPMNDSLKEISASVPNSTSLIKESENKKRQPWEKKK